MEKKLLLALDDSMHSKNAVKYVLNVSKKIRDLRITLFTVQSPISGFLVDEAKTNLKTRAAIEKVKKKKHEEAIKMLESHKSTLVDFGMAEDRIDIKTQLQNLGTAKDILEFAEFGRYDAIVVGRRGLSRVQEMFMGSLTSKLVEHSKIIPVWVIDGEPEFENIVAAIDGSESSLRSVDHISFMVSANPEVKITLLHVAPGAGDVCPIDFSETEADVEEMILEGVRRCVQDFFSHAEKKFCEAGLKKEQIEIKEVDRKGKIGKIILSEVDKMNVQTVVVGRSGIDKAFFIGSVSKYVLDTMENKAVWLVS